MRKSVKDHIITLQIEIAVLKSRLQPTDTGHLYTAISVLEGRVKELQDKFFGEEVENLQA